MMPDPQPVASFEQGFAALLDVIDRLRRLDPPKEPEGVHGVIRWMEDFKRAVSTMPTLPDTTQLSSFAEEVSQSVGEVEKAAAIGARGARGAGQAIGGINTNREPPPFLMSEQRLYRAKVTAVETGDNGWIVHVSANPVAGEVIDTDITLTLKATSQPAEGVLPVDPDTPTEMRVGFRNIDIGDYVAYVPYASYDQAETTFDGVLVPHAGDAAEGATETGAYLSTQAAWSMTHFWATITSGTGPTYAWTGDPGYSGDAAEEVNGVLGIPAGTRVRMFGYQGVGSEPFFEYRITESGDVYTGGPGIDVTGLKISFDYNGLKGLGVEGVGDAAVAVVKLTDDAGLQFGVAGGVEVKPNEDLAIQVDGDGVGVVANEDAGITADADGVAMKVEAALTSSLYVSGAGELTHLEQDPSQGGGMPLAIAGENLGWYDSEPPDMFDDHGHFNPAAEPGGTLIHVTPGELVGNSGVDANGHVGSGYQAAPEGAADGDILYWWGANGGWTVLSNPGAGTWLLASNNGVLGWVTE